MAAINFMLRPVDSVKEGVKRSKNGIFRIATLNDEFVLVTTKEKVAEYLKASDGVLSMQDGANDVSVIKSLLLTLLSRSFDCYTRPIQH